MAIASPTAERLAAGFRSYRFPMMDPPSDFEGKKELLQSILNAESIEECAVNLPIAVNVPNVSCYGPGMDYTGHPDAVPPPAPARYFSSGSAPRDVDPGAGSLPTGDLGIWGALEGDQACAAAQLNRLINTAANRVDTALYLGAITTCVMKHSEIEVPEEGDPALDLTAEVNDVLGMGKTGPFALTEVTLERLADVGDDIQLHYTFVLDDSGSSTLYDSDFYHLQDPTDQTSYSGVISNSVASYVMADPPNGAAYSLQYRRSGNDLEARMLSADFAGGQDMDQVWNEGILDVESDWIGNFGQTIYHVDTSTGDSEVTYAWQAGTGDSHARVFNAYVHTDDDEEKRGCGWFGYGPRFENGDMGTPELSDNTIERFICNWAGPSNNHNLGQQEGLAQKQCMILDNAEGIFVIDEDEMSVAQSFITYAPTNSCDVGNPADFNYQVTALSENVMDAQITNTLVTLADDPQYDEWLMSFVPTWVE